MTPTTAEPTLEEQVLALKETAARLAAERDAAMWMASQATKDQVRERREHLARLRLKDVLITSLRAGRETDASDKRRLNARVLELAVTVEDLQRQNEELRQQLEAAQQRPERKSWLGRRIGNSL